MEIKTRQLGIIQVEEDKIITFPRGLVGFENVRQFSLLQDPEFAPFCWLQGIDRPDLTLVVVPAMLIKADYQLLLPPADKELLQATDDDPLAVIVIAVIKEVFEQSTVNFLAPVVINERTRRGVQTINEREGYSTRHLLMDEVPDHAKEGENHAGADAQEKTVVDARG